MAGLWMRMALVLGLMTAGVAQAAPLYRITRGTEVAYLMGTVHVGDAQSGGLDPAARSALQESATLILELDVRDQAQATAAVERYGSYGRGDSLERHLHADTLNALRAALHAEGIPLHEVSHRKPWLVANWLAGMSLSRAGWQRRLGTEFTLLANSGPAQGLGSLESAASQLALFDSMNETEAEAYLRDTLSALADGRLLAQARLILAAASSGDVASLEQMLAAADAGQVAAFTRDVLLGQRNPAMAAAIEKALQAQHTAFVGVGLLHLVGDKGLPALLAQRGYQVERLH